MTMVHTHDVRGELDEEDGDAAQRQRHADRDVDEVRGQLWDVLRQSVGDGFLQVIKDKSTYGAKRVKNKMTFFTFSNHERYKYGALYGIRYIRYITCCGVEIQDILNHKSFYFPLTHPVQLQSRSRRSYRPAGSYLQHFLQRQSRRCPSQYRYLLSSAPGNRSLHLLLLLRWSPDADRVRHTCTFT